jgi:aryl-alcohol dehydrogenase-like predicted oxidoreductase
MKKITLGTSDLQVTPICLGTMTFGEQVAEKEAHQILDRSLALGVNFLDTAEMYSVPKQRPVARLKVFWGTGLPTILARGKKWCWPPK